MACEYNDTEDSPVDRNYVTRTNLSGFLSQLHRKNPEKFGRFMDYCFTDIFRVHGTPHEWSAELIPYLEDFMRDLKALGYELGSGHVRLAIGSESQMEAEMVGELELMLEKFDPELLKMHQGAWDTLLSVSPDSYRQAIGSARELLNHTLDILGGGGGGTRKERISKIIGGADADTIEAVANLVNKLYALQSKGTHAEPTFERAFFVIKSTEYVLYYLLKSDSKSDLSQSD